MATKIISQNNPSDLSVGFHLGILNPDLKEKTFERGIPQQSWQLSDLVPERFCPIDEKWVSMFSEFLSVAASGCSLIGGDATKEVPLLSVILTPINLYQAAKLAKESFNFALMAFKTSGIAEDLLYYTAKGIGAVSTAMSESIKPFTGAIALAVLICGLANLPSGIAFASVSVIPIVLIALSILSAPAQAWALSRSAKAFHAFKLERKQLNGQALEVFLHKVKAPLPTSEKYELEFKNWEISHFTNSERREMLQDRIEHLLGFDKDKHTLIAQQALGEALRAISLGDRLILEDRQKATSALAQVDEMLDLSRELTTLVDKLPNANAFEGVKAGLKEGIAELEKIKQILISEGADIADKLQSEMERRIAEQSLALLSVAVGLISAVLSLSFFQYQMVASAISISSALLCISSVILNKSVFRSYFQPTEDFQELNQGPILDSN